MLLVSPHPGPAMSGLRDTAVSALKLHWNMRRHSLLRGPIKVALGTV